MRRYWIPVVLSLLTVGYLFYNTSDVLIYVAELELGTITEPGTPKSSVMSFFEQSNYRYWEVSEAEGNYYWPSRISKTKVCMPFGGPHFQWQCQYPSLVRADKEVGFLALMDPQLSLVFAFNEKDELVEYARYVGYTFL